MVFQVSVPLPDAGGDYRAEPSRVHRRELGCGGPKGEQKRFLSDIYETARESTALPVPTDSAAIAMFRLVIMQRRQLIQHRDAIEADTRRRVGEYEDFQRLRQIPGIGPIHALTILAEAGDLRRFDHYRQFLKFCGFNLATHQRYVKRDPEDADLKRKALTAVAAKVARVAYAMIKHDTDYRPLHGLR